MVFSGMVRLFTNPNVMMPTVPHWICCNSRGYVITAPVRVAALSTSVTCTMATAAICISAHRVPPSVCVNSLRSMRFMMVCRANYAPIGASQRGLYHSPPRRAVCLQFGGGDRRPFPGRYRNRARCRFDRADGASDCVVSSVAASSALLPASAAGAGCQWH